MTLTFRSRRNQEDEDRKSDTGTEQKCALFKIKDPQSLLNAAAQSSVTDGCAADDLSQCLDVRVLYRTKIRFKLDPANFCLISACVALKPRLLYGVLSIKAVITVTHS